MDRAAGHVRTDLRPRGAAVELAAYFLFVSRVLCRDDARIDSQETADRAMAQAVVLVSHQPAEGTRLWQYSLETSEILSASFLRPIHNKLRFRFAGRKVLEVPWRFGLGLGLRENYRGD